MSDTIKPTYSDDEVDIEKVVSDAESVNTTPDSGSGSDSSSVGDSLGDSESESDNSVIEDDEDTVKSVASKINVSTDDVLDKFINDSENIDDNATVDSDFSEDEYVKFDEDIRKDQILNYHNELVQSNFDEISALTKVVRNKEGIIVDPLHKTIPILTKFERTRILGLRAKQINNGDEPLIKIADNIIQGYIIAEMELEAKVLPFIVSRPLPNGKKEYWKLNDLEQIDY